MDSLNYSLFNYKANSLKSHEKLPRYYNLSNIKNNNYIYNNL